MVPSITAVRMSGAGRESLPVLVLGPSAGVSASALWSTCASELRACFDVVAWDLPGQGYSPAVPEDDHTLGELTSGVLAVVDDILDQRGEHDGPFFVAGVGLGGQVAQQLLVDAPERVRAALSVAEHPGPAAAPSEVAQQFLEHFLGVPRLPDGGDRGPRTASVRALSGLVASGRHEEFIKQLREALANGVTLRELEELL